MSLRSTNIDRLKSETFDVLIIGGGINGAVSAAALAARGAKVALVDRGDFAGFTSMQSSNLVWGGFKYLENYEISLVRHLCKSRNQLIKAYPENLREIRFLSALDKNSPYKPWFAGLGANAYWTIGNFFTKRPKVLSKKKIKAAEPIIDDTNVIGGIEYSDAYVIDNDSRFVFSFVRTALNFGAACVNYVRFYDAKREDGLWHLSLKDTDQEEEFTAKAKVVINAAGPFVDSLNEKVGIKSNHRIVFSKGIHLIVPQLTKEKRVLAFFDDTQRLFYVIPMGPRSVIGTTDERVDDPVTQVTAEDRDFLLEQINERLALEKPLTPDDVISTRCGVRPLVVDASGDDEDETDWTKLSRKHAVEVNQEQKYVTIYGGKITDCVNVGQEICDIVRTLGISLDKENHDWYGEPSEGTREEFFRQARHMGLDDIPSNDYESLSTRLWRRYGLRAFAMLEEIREDPAMADEVIEGAEYVRCELYYAARTEMITKFDDFLRRRSKIALVLRREDIANAEGIQEAAELLFGKYAQYRYDQYFAPGGSADKAEKLEAGL
ncbi:MAG: FAD-dependent oxidoreductase [Candidatus Nanopelagicales bacterium]